MKRIAALLLVMILATTCACVSPVQEGAPGPAAGPTARPTAESAAGPTAGPTAGPAAEAPISYLLAFNEYYTPNEFTEAAESDGDFEQYRERAGNNWMGIETRGEAQAIWRLISGLPFPVSSDYFWSQMKFSADEGRNFYSVCYNLYGPDYTGMNSGYIEFGGDITGPESLPAALDERISQNEAHYYPVDTAGHPHVTKLYGTNGEFADFLYYYAEIDGSSVGITTRGLSREGAEQAILSFDFTTLLQAAAEGFFPPAKS